MSCPGGSTVSGGSCYYETSAICPSGYSYSSSCAIGGPCCYKHATVICPSGYTFQSGSGTCVKTSTSYGTATDCYDSGWHILQFGSYTYSPPKAGSCSTINSGWTCYSGDPGGCPAGTANYCSDYDNLSCTASASASCPSGYWLPAGNGWCSQYTSFVCPAGYYSNGSTCTQYAGNACPSGYSYNSSTNQCQTTTSACSSGSYNASLDKCSSLSGGGCSFPPYGWSYDSASNTCIHTTNAQCSVGSRMKTSGSSWSACYLLDTTHGTPPGHIYCPSNLTYWDTGNKEGCYKKDSIACNGNYNSSQVILGSGNSYGEWTGQCWDKTQNICSTGEIEGRGLFTTNYHCLDTAEWFDTITTGQVGSQALSQYLCEYESHNLFSIPSSRRCYHWSLPHDDAYTFNDPHTPVKNYNQICPTNPTLTCNWLGGNMDVCGVKKLCSACKKIGTATSSTGIATTPVAYFDIKSMQSYGSKWYGISLNVHSYSEAKSEITLLGGRMATSADQANINKAFNEAVTDYWLDGNTSPTGTKNFVIIWDNLSNTGFVSKCVYDIKGNQLCTSDMKECTNGVCPLGNFPCQTYQGAEYCSKYSTSCTPLAVPGNQLQDTDTSSGLNDKKNNGTVNSAGKCLGQIYIFNGKDKRCRTAGLETAFTNLCVKKKSFLGIVRATVDEKLLAKLRVWHKLDGSTDPGNGQCHYVGEYCASKFLGLCVQKKKTYCCFSSPLARIIQEQGRSQPQINLSWGTPKSPNCEGFTPSQFQKIDFSKINFKAYFGDILKVQSATISNASNNAVNKFKQSLNNK